MTELDYLTELARIDGKLTTINRAIANLEAEKAIIRKEYEALIKEKQE